MEKRLDAVRSVQGAEDFISIEFGDYGAAFYTSHEGETEELLAGNDWSFVELDENETDNFSEPESRLSYGVMVVHNGARGCYRMYGKHTNDEYYTEELPFGEIIEQIRNHTGSLATTSNI
jgi:hypothetical protein